MDLQHELELDEVTAGQNADQIERDRVRKEYRARLAEKLRDPAFRAIEGFPQGTDEAILALSDPPYYTACPNPFIEEWISENGKPYDAATDTYHREPFAADVSEGKNDPIYNAHSYHTKVPHKAIMRYILHYTEPGDVVYDGFCGTGMMGVAAQMCGNKAQVESLGYQVDSNGIIQDRKGQHFSTIGVRKAILNDLSPAATFIAYNYNTPVDAANFRKEAKRILSALEFECGWMYSTLHDANDAEISRVAKTIRESPDIANLRGVWKELGQSCSLLNDSNSKLKVGRINYTVWSDVLLCPHCGGEIVFWEAAFIANTGKVADSFECSHCRAETTKKKSKRAMVTRFDSSLGKALTETKQLPVLLNYTVNGVKYERKPNEVDLAQLETIAKLPITNWQPTNPLPIDEMYHGSRLAPKGVTHLHHFHLPRPTLALALLWSKAKETKYVRLQRFLLFMAEQMIWSISKLNRYRPDAFSQANQYMNGVYYLPSQMAEVTPWYILDGKIKRLADAFSDYKPIFGQSIINTGTCSIDILPAETLDYIFTDPPFGENIYYADLNYLVESWHGIITDAAPEAIIDQAKKKKLADYQDKMAAAFRAYYRALKPGRWMTVEFSNSSNAVWNAIQEGLERVGFVVADIRVLNKQSGSYRQVTAASAVKEDLVISCYKPRSEFETRFHDLQGQPEGVVEFVRQHLTMLPIAPLSANGKIEPVSERNRFLLFDRMIGYHLQKGARIPVSASEFYRLLEDDSSGFFERDGMYFLPEQVARYDAMKTQGIETEQLSIFVQDEKSAVQWIRGQLTGKSQSEGDLNPKFMQELKQYPAHEPKPELRDLLKEYFLQSGDVWRVPDPTKEKDIEALRQKAMLKQFQGYVEARGQLKSFRTEAVIEGFRYCWDTKQYGIIVIVCEKIPAKTLQEIHDLVQFYDIAKELAPEKIEQLEFEWNA